MAAVPFPRTGAPALRALDEAGYEHLQQLDGVAMRDVLALHGMGPKGIGAYAGPWPSTAGRSPMTTPPSVRFRAAE